MAQIEYTPQNLEYAVSVFYNGEQLERANAHAWLTAAQRVPEAWKFVWELLQSDKGTEVQFYAATTLHTKILRCWNELPTESYDELKEKILEAIFAYAKGPKIVTNRLCISLAAFILQQGTVDLATILRPLSTPENTALLLEVLTVIPEEYNSMTMSSGLRSKNRAVLQQACPAILNDMLRCMEGVYNDFKEPPSEDLMKLWQTCASCANSWLSLGGEDNLDNNNVPLSELLPLCRILLQIIRVLYMWNECVSDTALDACEAALAAVRAAGAAGDAARQPASALLLATELAALAAAVLAKDNVPNSINEELLSSLVTCLVAIGECHSNAIVNAVQDTPTHQGAQQLIEVLLAAQIAPGYYLLHETRSNLTFGFWYTLQDEILCANDSSKEMNPIWTDIFSRLLMGLVTKSEAASENSLSRDELELLRRYRQDISDTVMYCFGVLGERCWVAVEASFEAAGASEARREAALHVFAALSDSAPRRRAPRPLLNMLAQAVGVITAATATAATAATDGASSSAILETALECLGNYASWLGSVRAAEAPDGGEAGAGSAGSAARECVAAAGAALARCPAAAALALRRLCTECAPAAAALADRLVHAAQSAEGRSDMWVRRQLLGAAGAALAAADLEVARPLLKEMATTLEKNLRAQALDPTRPSGAAECVATLLTSLTSEPELIKDLLTIVMPTLPAYSQHRTLIEPMFHILKQTVSTLMEDSFPMINDIAQLTISAFNCQPCPSGHELVKLIIIILGDEWSESARLLHVCVATSARAAAADPPAAEGLFQLLIAITKKKPHYIDAIEHLIPDLIELAARCMRMWEAAAARAAVHWLAALAVQRPPLVQPHAPALVVSALRCIGGCTPRLQVEPLSELLLAMNRAEWSRERGDLPAWLRLALAPPDFPTAHATHAHKQKFLQTVIREKTSKRRILDTVREFSLVCRGLIDTEYGRQSLASTQLVT